jgi:hypothetical protein
MAIRCILESHLTRRAYLVERSSDGEIQRAFGPLGSIYPLPSRDAHAALMSEPAWSDEALAELRIYKTLYRVEWELRGGFPVRA